MRTPPTSIALAIVWALSAPLLCHAQPGSLDMTFNPTDQGNWYGDWHNGPVNSIAILPDDKMLVAGAFTSTNGISTVRVARLNSDGSRDTTFNVGTGPNNSVAVVLPLTNGNIMVGGCFDSFSGTYRGHITCISSNGDYLPSQNIGSGAQSSVHSVAAQPDGQLIIGGSLSQVNGVFVHGIARLNVDGSLDPTFNAGTGTNGAVIKIVIQDDGKILAIGNFFQFGGVLANQVIRLNDDGTIDTSFNIGSGSFQNTRITDLVLQDDGKVILAGEFTSFNGVARDGIVRLNQDGSVDLGFDPDLGSGYGAEKIAIRDDGRILVCRVPVPFNSNERFTMMLLNQNGSQYAQFSGASEMIGKVYSIGLQSDGRIILGGRYGALSTSKNLIRLLADGTFDSQFQQGSSCNGQVNSIITMPDGGYLISGSFTGYFNSLVNNVVRVSSTGSTYDPFISGDWTFEPVRCSALTPEGKIVVGGLFNQQSPTERTSVVQMHSNGSLDASFSPSVDANGTVRDLQVLQDGDIIIVGEFDTINGIRKPHIARLNMDGSLDESFLAEQGVNGNVHSCAIQPDGKIIIGGAFYMNNGITTGRVLRLNADGSTDDTFNTLFGANTDVNSIAIQQDGKVILVGNFTMYGGVTLNRIVRLNPDATMDLTFNTGTGANNQITDVVVQPDGKIVIVGLFTTFNGITKNRICRLHPDGSVDEEFTGSGTDYGINTVSMDNNGDLMIGGLFSEYDGTGRNRVARLNNDIDMSIGEEPRSTVQPILFPNPTSDRFTINNLRGPARVELADNNGRLLSVVENYQGQSIDVGGIDRGIYVVRVVSDSSVYIFRLVRQ